MRYRDDMTFPMEEYERRITELRQRMEQRRLAAVVISDPGNLMYLTDYQTTGYSYFQALVVPLESEPFMITRQMEESNVIARTWVELSYPYSDSGDAIQTLLMALREHQLGQLRVGYERNSYFFPAYQQDRFHSSFQHGTLLDCHGIVEQGRLCKSEHEIRIMHKAAAATEAGMQAGFEAAGEGVTENEIAAAICAGMFRAGGEYPAVLPYVTSGPRTMIGHATWEGRTVQAGEHIFLEVGGCFRRYHTAMMRTVVVGEPSESLWTAERIMQDTLLELHATLQPGMTVSDVDNMVRRMIMDNNVGAQLVTRAGYSIGIAFPPSWDEGSILSVKQGSREILLPGMTLHIIPWMWGVDGDKTCGISDTIYITDDGCKSFFTLDPGFVVKEGGSAGSRPRVTAPASDPPTPADD